MPDNTDVKIQALSDKGNTLMDQGLYKSAVRLFEEAMALVPEPHLDQPTATWLHAAIGDARFLQNDYASAVDCFENAKQCPGGVGNPFVHLRLGQSYFELNQREKAANELAMAYMGDGLTVFEFEDPKYLDFLRTKIDVDDSAESSG